MAIAKPTGNLISFITRDTDPEAVNTIKLILKVVNLKVMAAGLYSPGQIDVARAAKEIKNNGDIAKLDLGLVISLKSGLPGFIVKPAVKKLLTDQGFTEISAGELTLYRGYPNRDKKEGVPILIRIEGNRIFAAVSGQESYARTLISNVHLK